jgi:hypothetical protein
MTYRTFNEEVQEINILKLILHLIIFIQQLKSFYFQKFSFKSLKI